MTNLKKKIGKLLTPPKKFFNWCESHIPTYEWQNKEKTILASNRKNCPLIKKRLTKNSRLSFSAKFYPFAIILVSKKRIEIQSYDYWHEVIDGKEELSYRLTNFERFSNNQHLKACYHTNSDTWFDGLVSNYGFMSGAYTNTEFYPNHWQEKLKKNDDMKYLELPSIYRHEIKRIYKYRKEIEYLQNIGANKLAMHVCYQQNEYFDGSFYSTVNMAVINRKWLKKHKAILKNTNPLFNDIMLDETLKKRNAKRVTGIEKVLHYKQIKQLPKEINLNKFQTYILKQDQSFNYYMDYLKMIEELNITLNDNTIIFPKDLEKAHDNAVDMINQLKIEQDIKERQEIEKRHQEILENRLKLEKEIDEFVFIVPKELQDIIKEGNSLHHCVGSNSYLEEHAKGQTNIIFIRKKDDTETSYFTLEYRNKHVQQIQGKYNREEIPKSVKQAVEKWQKAIEKVG